MALKYSKELNYVCREEIEPTGWYERSNKKDKNIKFYNKINENSGYILIRNRFGNPRIDIYGPEKDWLVCIEVSPDGDFKESQVFNVRGIEMFKKIYDDVMLEVSKK